MLHSLNGHNLLHKNITDSKILWDSFVLSGAKLSYYG